MRSYSDLANGNSLGSGRGTAHSSTSSAGAFCAARTDGAGPKAGNPTATTRTGTSRDSRARLDLIAVISLSMTRKRRQILGRHRDLAVGVGVGPHGAGRRVGH